jgi:hypothetical protein
MPRTTVLVMGPALYLLWGLAGAGGTFQQLRDAFVDALTAAGRVHLGFAPVVLLLAATVAYRDHALVFGLAARARTYVQVLIAGTATFGVALGFYRGGAQILFAAVKLPLVTLLMLATVAPLLHALNQALQRPAHLAREVTLLIAALARGALVLAAETPLITMGVVGTQASWIWRPYLARPRASDVVFVHPLEGSFSEALGDSLSSARGVYRGGGDER